MKLKKHKAKLAKQIQKQQQQTEILYQSHAFLSSILNNYRDGIAAFAAVRDNSGKIKDFSCLVINPVAAKILNRDRKEEVGNLLTNQSFESLEPQLFAWFVRVVETGMIIEKDISFQNQHRRTWYQLAITKLGDGVSIAFHDITERKQIEFFWQDANSELYRQANIDSLTQVFNRRRFDEYFLQEWHRCTREQQPLTLILCDVDFFKSYNDRYGHQAGDICLQQIAQAICETVKRPGDLVARYGGEEFAVVLSNTNIKGAEYVAKQISEQVRQLKLVRDDIQQNQYVTISLGVSCLIPNPKISADSLIASADRALYKAKNQGRDRFAIETFEAQHSF
jgi:diguanylate cyclase (GGDEF)-like protein